MKPASFEYCRPDSLKEAFLVLEEFGDDAVVMAGGLSLGALLNMRMVRPKIVIDINRLDELALIEKMDTHLRIGALARQEDVLKSADCGVALPLLVAGLQNVGHYQTRSRGTLGGSVAHADPSAEASLCLVTLGGEVELSSVRGVRRLAANAFFKGALMTEREDDEMVTALYWPIQKEGVGIAFEEINERHGDFAIVAAAAWAEYDGERFRCGLGLGGVEERPSVFFESGGGDINGISEEVVKKATKGLAPMNDRRASCEYRNHLAGHLGYKAITKALQNAIQ